MDYRRLGNTGLKVSELSFGSWVTYGNQMGADAAGECMAAAYDAGVNFFDNAEVYAKGESEYARLYHDIGLGTTIWSPLASGMLTGKYNDGIPQGSRGTIKGYEWLAERLSEPEKIAAVKRLAPIASDLGCTLAQMSLAWCLKNPNVSTVITGASRSSQVVENMKARDVKPKLTPDGMARIEASLVPG